MRRRDILLRRSRVNGFIVPAEVFRDFRMVWIDFVTESVHGYKNFASAIIAIFSCLLRQLPYPVVIHLVFTVRTLGSSKNLSALPQHTSPSMTSHILKDLLLGFQNHDFMKHT